MENRSITSGLPSASRAYVFGSFLTTGQPQDIDILVNYDPVICPPADAYEAHTDFIDYMQESFGLRVDLTLLTYEEEQSSGFIQATGAVPIAFTDGKLVLGRKPLYLYQTDLKR
jgi:predicted nucleotidyltransferase